MRTVRNRFNRNYMPPESASVTSTGDLQSLLAAVAPQWAELDPPAKQLASLVAFGRRANAGADVTVLLQDAAALCAEIVQADLSGIGQFDTQRNKLVLKLGTADVKGNAQWLHVREIELWFGKDAQHDSMASYAHSVGEAVLSADLVAESRFKDAFLRGIGVRSAITVPLHLCQQPFGTIGVYNTSQTRFSEEDSRFLEAIGHLLSRSIARLRAEEALARQAAMLEQFLQQVDSLVFGLDEQGRILSMNKAAERTSGFRLHEIRGRHVVSVLVVAREAEKFGQFLRQAAKQSEALAFETAMVVKDGQQRWVSWTIRSLGQQPCPGEPALLLTGTDRTAELEAQSQAARAKAAAERSANKLHQLYHSLLEGERPAAGEVLAAAQESLDAAAASSDGALPGRDLLQEAQNAMAFAELGVNMANALAGQPTADQPGDHQPFRPQQGGAGHEKRSSPRRQFKYHQLIGPVYGDVLPSPQMFFTVACEDISAGGIAFYLDQAPDFQKVVIALGKPPTLAYFAADVVRYSKKQFGEKTMYLVGCRFTKRIPSSDIEG